MHRFKLYLIILALPAAALAYSDIASNEQHFADAEKVYVIKSKVSFLSKAPLERIEASSTALGGAITTSDNTFSFQIAYTSFYGFNSTLQREHFNENFMESAKYIQADFSGRIIDPVPWNEMGNYNVRVKGILDIHGVTLERILQAKITIQEDNVLIYAQFPIQISDHNITIPRVLNQKIAEEVTVTVAARLSDKK